MAVIEPEVAALQAKERAKRMLVLVNPIATAMKERLRHLAVYALQGRYDVTAVETQRRGHAIELCREAAGAGFDVVVAFGGDGTVNEAANGLAGSRTALTTLPGGSNNVFAKELGIPTDVVDATEHLLGMADRWEPRQVDLGVLNGRFFTFAAGMGLDASVVKRVDGHPALKARFGPFYFVESAIVTFLSRYVVNPPRLTIEVDGAPPIRGVSAFVQNAGHYTYFNSRPVELVEGGGFESGALAGVVLTRARPYDVPTVSWRAVWGADRQASRDRGLRGVPGGGRAVRGRSPAPGACRRRLRRGRARSALRGRARRAPGRRLASADEQAGAHEVALAGVSVAPRGEGGGHEPCDRLDGRLGAHEQMIAPEGR